ncbi:MAG: hypothetical protein R3Y36_08880 [Spirochaetales bacterium]
MDYGRKRHKHRNNKHYRDNAKQGNSFAPAQPEIIQKHVFDTELCVSCGNPIEDLASALSDRATGKAIHFDCALETLNKSETLAENEKITYIGQGRFAVVLFENQHDLRQFQIIRIIEWEERNTVCEWRSKFADVYSKIK